MLKVADFFCGGGGFSEGFRQAGFEIVFAVDKWEPAVLTYKGNKPTVNVIQDDVIRISKLPDKEFEALVPDTEVIIGSPPCQSFSRSNKSGNADKTLGIELIEAYLRIIARKKFKNCSTLKYWVLENVPGVENYIKEEYTAADLGLEGDFILRPRDGESGVYNAKYYGAPTNRKRYLCGEFPILIKTKNDDNVVTLKEVLDSLGNPLSRKQKIIEDINYPDFCLQRNLISDHHYIYELANFEWEQAKRLKKDRGYMGKMAFPENLNKPARTVMATMSSSSREAMILRYKKDRYRLPTVREAASMMSFPIDYWFYGNTKSIKHTLVGNSVPPKLSYALAKAIAIAENKNYLENYTPIQHNLEIDFINLNGKRFQIKEEQPRKIKSKFKYHIPYLIISSYRVELTNYHSNFEEERFKWDTEIHYSQGKNKARIYQPKITYNEISSEYKKIVEIYINSIQDRLLSYNMFQVIYCMTKLERDAQNLLGPFELLDDIKNYIDNNLSKEEKMMEIIIDEKPNKLPVAIVIGYLILSKLTKYMGGV